MGANTYDTNKEKLYIKCIRLYIQNVVIANVF